jgi:hypothetical protein
MARFAILGSSAGVIVLTALCVVGCGTTDPSASEATEMESVGTQQAAMGVVAPSRGCLEATAGSGWNNAFLPQSTLGLTLTFRNWPGGGDAQGHPVIDGVVGLSNGPAARFADMGPIVRFNPNGYIDARDGDHYAGAFPYKTSEPFEVQMSVDIEQHHYTVYVRHTDALNKPWELLASNLAFRTEQQSATRLDNVGSFIDAPGGSLQSCGFSYQAPEQCTVSYQDATTPDTWRSRAFPARSGRFQLDFDALPASRDGSPTLDAVIGASLGAPTSFSKLGTIVRFRPDGKLDARNGATYAADADFSYANTTSYHVNMDIDTVQHRYSVTVKNNETPDAAPTLLARDYAFRTEQAATSSFDHLGQFIDGGQGAVYVCSLAILY